MNIRKFLLMGGLVAGFAMTVVSAPANAERNAADASQVTKSFVVNSITDAVDADPGDGRCSTELKKCTLRAAVQETNALPGKQRIYVPAGGYSFTLPDGTLANEDDAATGDLDIRDDVEIYGQGTGMVIVDAKELDRVFDVLNNGETGASLYLARLTVRGGSAGAFSGGGGGIRNSDGTLTLHHVLVSNNDSGKGRGAGVYNSGILKMYASTIQNGRAYKGGGLNNEGEHATAAIERSTIMYNYAYNNGAGILNNGGDIELINSTIAYNEAWKNGGGIANELQGNFANRIRIRFSTITQNVADAEAANGGGAGGIFNISGATVEVEDSIIAGNTDKEPGGVNPHPDCFGVFQTGGYNLIGIAKFCSGLTNGVEGDKVGTLAAPIDPRLEALNFVEGPTAFAMLKSDSPAIDADDTNRCFNQLQLPLEQRGHKRSSDGGCDTGAVEFGADCAKPETPQLFRPAFKQRVKNPEVAIEWYKADCAASYKVMVKQDSPQGPKAFKKDNETGLSLVTPALAKGHTYWVRVSACNATGCAKGEWTQVKVRN